jgi:hypothetical protein
VDPTNSDERDAEGAVAVALEDLAGVVAGASSVRPDDRAGKRGMEGTSMFGL